VLLLHSAKLELLEYNVNRCDSTATTYEMNVTAVHASCSVVSGIITLHMRAVGTSYFSCIEWCSALCLMPRTILPMLTMYL
jgi:hypothetical protein